MYPPQRIVCLTEETVETLYLLGEQDRIAGVSGYAVRPPQVRKEKPRVSAFISADIPKILALKPDLVLTFSDLQADIVAALIRSGVAVHAFNHRDVAGIFEMIRTIGALVGVPEKADALALSLQSHLDGAAGNRRADKAQATRLFRGMGRTDDFRHRLGIRTDRSGRRHRGLPASSDTQERDRAHRERDRCYRREARHHYRLLVREEIRALESGCASGFRIPFRPCATINCTRSSRR